MGEVVTGRKRSSGNVTDLETRLQALILELTRTAGSIPGRHDPHRIAPARSRQKMKKICGVSWNRFQTALCPAMRPGWPRLSMLVRKRCSAIGLSTPREFVRNHGGELTFAWQPGKATTATVVLPLFRVNEAAGL